MNFISLAVSVFISNYIFMAIIRLLPVKRKKLWQAIIISLADISSILGYAWMFILSLEGGFDLTITLELSSKIPSYPCSIEFVTASETAVFMSINSSIVISKFLEWESPKILSTANFNMAL